MAVEIVMKKGARISLLVLLAAGLWLALKPTAGNRRLTFLPVHWSEYVDFMDFWFNLGAFALLAATAWLAFGTWKKVLGRACLITGFITLLNVMLELLQSSIPGRAMDLADVWAGLLGCVLGIVGSMAVQLMTEGRKSSDGIPQVLFLDQTGRLGGAELMLLDIASARAADSEVVLFQDGEFRSALENAGVKTRVLRLDDEASSVNKQAGLLHVLRSIPGIVQLILQTAQASRSFDVVYANTAKALIIGGPAARLAGRPLIFHLHDIIADGHFSPINQCALIFCANCFADRVIANSEATKDAFVARGGRAELCVVIPNGFHIPEERTNKDDLKKLRFSCLNIPSDAFIVLMAGRLAHWKGQHVLLEALKPMPSAHAVLLGDALFTDEDREYAHRLHAQADESELTGRVHFAGFQSDTLAYFDLADVVVHASVFPEPFGRVIVEGMLAGKPVIASRAGGAAEIVSHEHTGLLVDPGNVNELAEALMRLQHDSAFAARLALNAQQTARDVYALPAVQRQIENLIRKAGKYKTDPIPGTDTAPSATQAA
ncbi:glycosyltransferase [Prosthecobacter sp.]|uniref:glycosyltransferase n=1 Tax=Prosthecobacter sp. TaxID=1965333 RepID=UPI001D1B6D7A|nr:glycosyltransferase [Prosthecobacter sp.]MCB1277994.1 glycosyltransferase [Prosthecobacter sp.]